MDGNENSNQTHRTGRTSPSHVSLHTRAQTRTDRPPRSPPSEQCSKLKLEFIAAQSLTPRSHTPPPYPQSSGSALSAPQNPRQSRTPPSPRAPPPPQAPPPPGWCTGGLFATMIYEMLTGTNAAQVPAILVRLTATGVVHQHERRGEGRRAPCGPNAPSFKETQRSTLLGRTTGVGAHQLCAAWSCCR